MLLALAFNALWGPLLFDLFAIYLLRIDAVLVGMALWATQPDMTPDLLRAKNAGVLGYLDRWSSVESYLP